jgi:hypothetical protein
MDSPDMIKILEHHNQVVSAAASYWGNPGSIIGSD